ncbi:MAG TPA: ribonuclease Z [Blastocatellia bacterium]|nr:ribonuclease Z [Blastocatellia bacterium]
MKVIPLGTSSGKPTLRRNVSALAVVREGEWLLFDCGEATQTQIIKAGLNPNRLSSIFITHLHGDHFNGVAGLLSTMGLDRRTRDLTLVGPHGINDYLETLARLKILFINYHLDLREFGPQRSAVRRADSNAMAVVHEAEQYRVSFLPLDHRVFTLGYRIEERPRPGRFNLERARELGIPEGPMYGRLQSGHNVELADGRVISPSEVLGPPRPGKTVAYCTDTRPCRAGVELARGVDLLIHEATFTDELAEEAREFGHSTARQAAEIAREAGAQRLLITHFSTRYPDPKPLLEEAREIFPETILADDLIEVEV